MNEQDYYDLVERDIRDETSEEAAQMLRDEPVRWLAVLGSLKKDSDCQFAQRKGELLQYQQKCQRDRVNGKQNFFDAKAKHEAWKGTLVGWTRDVETRLLEAKRLVAAANADKTATYEDNIARIADALEDISSALNRQHPQSPAE